MLTKRFFEALLRLLGNANGFEWCVERTCNEMRKPSVGPCLDLMGQRCTLWDTINIIVIRKRGRFHFTGLDHVYVWTGHIMTWSQISRLLHSPSLVANSTHIDTASTWETWIRIWTTFLDANTASMLDVVSCQHSFATIIGNLRCCNNIYRRNNDLCHCPMDSCWSHDIVPCKIKSYCNCLRQLTYDDWGIPKHKAGVLPVYIRRTTLQLTLTVFQNRNLNKWDLMFGF